MLRYSFLTLCKYCNKCDLMRGFLVEQALPRSHLFCRQYLSAILWNQRLVCKWHQQHMKQHQYGTLFLIIVYFILCLVLSTEINPSKSVGCYISTIIIGISMVFFKKTFIDFLFYFIFKKQPTIVQTYSAQGHAFIDCLICVWPSYFQS